MIYVVAMDVEGGKDVEVGAGADAVTRSDSERMLSLGMWGWCFGSKGQDG